MVDGKPGHCRLLTCTAMALSKELTDLVSSTVVPTRLSQSSLFGFTRGSQKLGRCTSTTFTHAGML